MNTMSIDGYVAAISFDDEAALLHGEVINTRDVLTFQATSAAALRQAFQDTLDDYRAWCAERGKVPEKPYSGALSLRLGPELHRRAAIAAARRGHTLNGFIREQIEKASMSDG